MLEPNKFVSLFFALLILNGCASTVFPDFETDDDVVVDEGGRIEVRKVDESGILVADKENAAYEDDDLQVIDFNAEEKVEPAKVVSVERENIAPLIVETDEFYSADGIKVEEKFDVAMAAKETDVKNEIKLDDNSKKTMEKVEDANLSVPTMHYLADMIYFANGSSEVDDEGMKILRKLARTIKEMNATVDVYGYASSRTNNTDPATHKLVNFEVSAKRAESVAKILRKYGVKKDVINVQALSDSKPLYLEVMPEGERLNRRVEIYLTY